MNNRKTFYGWYIVLMAFTANFMSAGTGFYLMNAFMEPLCEARNWTRTDISLAPAYATVFGLMAQMVFGTIVNPALKNIADLSWREVAVMVPLLVITIWFGFHPNPILDVSAVSVEALMADFKAGLAAAQQAPLAPGP